MKKLNNSIKETEIKEQKLNEDSEWIKEFTRSTGCLRP